MFDVKCFWNTRFIIFCMSNLTACWISHKEYITLYCKSVVTSFQYPSWRTRQYWFHGNWDVLKEFWQIENVHLIAPLVSGHMIIFGDCTWSTQLFWSSGKCSVFSRSLHIIICVTNCLWRRKENYMVETYSSLFSGKYTQYRGFNNFERNARHFCTTVNSFLIYTCALLS